MEFICERENLLRTLAKAPGPKGAKGREGGGCVFASPGAGSSRYFCYSCNSALQDGGSLEVGGAPASQRVTGVIRARQWTDSSIRTCVGYT